VTRPTTSVVLAVRNGERFLAQALESILQQSYPPTELIVVDGGSTDRSAEIAASYDAVTVIQQSRDGLAQAWNQGVEASSGELIGFLDSDDHWLPGKQEAQVTLLEERPELAGVVAWARHELAPGADPPPGFRPELLDADRPGPMPGTLLVRREVFDQIGYFDEDYQLAMDVDWLARVKDSGLELPTMDRTVLVKRVHPSNLSHSRPEIYHRELVKALRESALRQQSVEPP
jgi:glycosyltransferase involved in cell wall biosynthesis